MKTSITISNKILALLLFSFLNISFMYGQALPPANTSCTSNDLEVLEIKLTGGDACNSCTPGTILSRTLNLSIRNNTNSTRTSFAFWGTMEIYSGVDGSLVSSTTKTGCGGSIVGSGITSLDFGSVNYTCGDTIKFSNLWEAWTSANNNEICPLDPTTINPKCGKIPSITVNSGVKGELVQTNSQCGSATGTIDLTTTGGTAPYTYLWTASAGGVIPSGQSTNQDLTGLLPGTYTVVIKDVNNCTITKTRTISTTTAPVATLTSQTNVSCKGNATGSVTVAATAATGTSPYTYSKDGTTFGNSGTFASLLAGTYTITVKDANGCTDTETVTITEPAAALVAAIGTPTNVSCFGGNNGAATASATGGTTAYSYSWNTSPIQTTATASGLIAGTYIVTVTDDKGCTDTETVTITEPAQITLTATPDQIVCFGGKGSVTLSSDGAAPFTYGGDATTNLVAGTYNYTVTDANGCTATASATINAAPAQITLTATPDQIVCFGGKGSVTLSSDGAAPFTYGGDATTNLVAGTYNYTVTDANGCTATTSATINEAPAQITLTATPSQIVCFGGKGSVTLSSDGAAPFTYGGDATTNLVAGTYNYTVTDANGCTATASATINAAPAQITLTATPDQIVCFGGKGSVTLSSDGAAPFTYGGDATTNLVAGTYNYTVTDANGCTATASATINAAPAQITLTATPDQIVCFGGKGSVTLSSDGAAPFTYGGDATTNLVAGTYNYTVTDANGCTATTSATINAAPAQITLTATPDQIVCFGGKGSVTLSSDGAAPFTYGGDATTNLVAGTYNYTVTDANGCTATTSATINAAPAQITLTATPDQIVCFGGKGSVTLSSDGAAPFTYGGDATTNLVAGTYNYTVTDANGCTATASATINAAPAQITLTATPDQIVCFGGKGSVTLSSDGAAPFTYGGDATTNLVAGTYNYTVTDANGCTATASATINAAPAQITLTATPDQIVCFGGKGSVTLSSDGAAPFTYGGDATTNLVAGTYNYTVTDANGCTATTSATINAAPAQITLTATPDQIVCFGGKGSVTLSSDGAAPFTYGGDATTNLVAGTYNYTVTDANGCTATTSATINAAPAQITLTATPDQIVCFGGKGSVTLSSDGAAPFTYGGDATTNLVAGTYNYTVTDANGCTATTSATINAAPAQITLTATPDQIVCFGGKGSVTLSSDGAAPFTYGGDATTNLVAGTYNYTVTDANGCTATTSATINAAPAQITLTATPDQIVCFGGKGSVTLSSDGAAPFTYGGDATTNLVAGTYNYTVTDANGCTATTSATINAAPAQITLTATPDQIVCFGGKGSVTLSSDGAAPFTYGGDATTNLVAGTYNYTVTDANGCTATTSATINAAPAAPAAPLSGGDNIKCKNKITQTLTATASVNPDEYVEWYDSATNGSIVGFPTLNSVDTVTYYAQTVTNTNSCPSLTRTPVTLTIYSCAIVAQDDAGTSVNGYTGGTAFSNVLTNDTLNGVAVIPSGVTTTFVSTTNVGVTLSGTNVIVAAGTPAGSYTLTYQICEVLNTGNCDTAIVTVPVSATAIVANDDAGSSVNGYNGGTAFTNVIANDTLNGVAVIPSEVTTTFVSTTNVGVTLSGTNVNVVAGTPAGSYTLTYQICEVLNPGNCDTAIVTVPVSATAIVANDDAGSSVNGYNGGTAFTNVIANDTLNGVAVIPSEVTTTFVSTTNVGVTLSGTNVNVAAGTPAGSYTLTYQICEVLNPGNCDTAIVTLIVTAAIDAQDDTITDIDGTIGNPNAGNVLGNDSLNGGNMTIEQVDLQIKTLANSTGGTPVPFVNPDTGQISIPPGTAGGTYTIVYQICDVINLTNCDDATVTIDVATVLGCQSIVVHNAFSPNGDNKNATFVIDNIEDTACYPENTVEIYNRWGVLVFETKNYSTTNNFDGTSRGRTTISQSSGLPTGTYYYILNYTSYDNNNKIQTNKKDGYLYLTR